MRAVICAAGLGTRLLPYTKEYPKALLTVGEKTLLEHMLDKFSDLNFSDIIIIVGYKAEAVKQKIGNKYKRCNITYIYNPEYKETNNIYSLWLARNQITDGMVFLNADIIFQKNVLRDILESKYPDCAIVDSNIKITEDSIKVSLNDNRIEEIGKKISAKADGWAFGIYKLSQKSSRRYFELAERLFELGQKNISFVVPLQKMAHEVAIRVVYSGNNLWAEIDTIEDYSNAKKLFVQ